MSRRRLAVTLAAASVLAFTANRSHAAGAAASPWPMFRSNAQHTSSTTVAGALPVRPKVLWSVSMPTSNDYYTGNHAGVDNGWPTFAPSLDADGTVYVAAYSRLWAINPDGTVKWTTPHMGEAFTQPAVSDGALIYTSSTNAILALNKTDGSVAWSTSPANAGLGQRYEGGPVTLAKTGDLFTGDQADERIYQTGAYSYYVWSFDGSGNLRWKQSSQSGAARGSGGIALSSDESLVHARFYGGYFQSFFTSNGAYESSPSHLLGSPGGVAAIPGGSALTYSYASGANRLLSTGTVLWENTSHPVWNSATALASPAFADGRAFVAGSGGVLYCYDAATGNHLWSKGFGASLPGPPTLVNGTTGYVLTEDGVVHAFPADTGGTSFWTMKLYNGGSPITQMGAGGVIVSTNGTVYALHKDGFGSRQLYALGSSGATQITLSASTHRIAPVSSPYATLTAEVRDGSNNPVPGIPVTLSLSGPGSITTYGMTDVNGQMVVSYGGDLLSLNDTTSTITATTYDLTSSTQIFIEGSAIDHYDFAVSSQVPVGTSFNLEMNPKNIYGSVTRDSSNRGYNLFPVISGLNVSGSGSLSVTAGTLNANSTYTVVALQSYNRIENIQVKIVDASSVTSFSGPISVVGPDHFSVVVPTGTVTAGTPFRVIITAEDSLNQRVTGYAGTVSLSAVHATISTQAAAGILGVGSANLASGIVSLESQTYSKAESFRIKVLESATNTTGISSSMTVTGGAPSTLTLSANPGSLLQGQTAALTATVKDQFGNDVSGSTVTFSVTTGSGTLALSADALAAAAASTQAVTASGSASAVFGLPAGLTSSQRNVVQAQVNSLSAGATIYVSILVATSGGVVVQSEDPRTKVTVPANAFGFNVKITIQDLADLSETELAKANAAFNKGLGKFVQSFAKKVQALKQDGSNAGDSVDYVDLEFPYSADGSGNVTVAGAPSPRRISSVLIPQSVLRVYRLNETTDVWEQVSEGSINEADSSEQVVRARVKKVAGIYALGTPAYKEIAAGQAAAFASLLPSGSTITVSLPAGTFSQATRMEISFPSASDVPAAMSASGALKSAGLVADIGAADGAQPSRPVKIIVDYKDADVAGLDENLLRLARYDESAGVWTFVDSSVDVDQNRVTAFTSHFSLFGLMQAVAATDLNGAIVFPNPFRPSLGHGTITFANLKPDAEIKIFTVSGSFLRELRADDAGRAVFDGLDDGGAALPSGVYWASVSSDGERKTMKFAVER